MLNVSLIKNLFESRSKDFWLFESSVWLHTLAASTVLVFVPTFLYLYGYSLHEILLFYLVVHLFNLPLNFLAEHTVLRFGARLSVIIATVLNIVFFTSLSFLGGQSLLVPLLAVALLSSLYDAFYYVSTLYLFIGSNKKIENTGKNTGILNLVIGLAGLCGPLVASGVLFLFEDKKVLIFVAVTLFVLSLLPLFKLQEIKTKPDHLPVPFLIFFQITGK